MFANEVGPRLPIPPTRTRKGIDDGEFATLGLVDWFNNHRLLEPIGYVPLAEFEAAHYRKEMPNADPDEDAAPILDSRP
ncbi:MAG: hypothetical protein ACRDH7_13455 [Actinomycetota bacterium]